MTKQPQSDDLFSILFVLLIIIVSLLLFLYPDNESNEDIATTNTKVIVSTRIQQPTQKQQTEVELSSVEQIPETAKASANFDITHLLENTKTINNCPVERDPQIYQQVMYMLEDILDQTEYYYAKLTINDSLSVTAIYPTTLPKQFWRGYKTQLLKTLNTYSQKLSFTLIKPSEIVLIIIPEREEYIDLLNGLSYDGNASIGVYFPYTNLAFVNYLSLKQAINTATHESIHRLNQYFFGYTARAINEGLAKHLEQGDFNPTTLATELKQFQTKYNVLEPHELFSAYPIWPASEYPSLYFSSKLLTGYLIQQTPGLFSQLLQAEAENKCSSLSSDTYSQKIEKIIIEQETDYIHWREAL